MLHPFVLYLNPILITLPCSCPSLSSYIFPHVLGSVPPLFGFPVPMPNSAFYYPHFYSVVDDNSFHLQHGNMQQSHHNGASSWPWREGNNRAGNRLHLPILMNSLEELGAPLGPGRCQVCTARRRRLRRRFAVPSAAALRAGVHTCFHRIPLDFTGFHKAACAGGWRGLTTDSHRRISQGLTGFPRVARYSTGFHRIPRDWLAARLAGWLAQRLGVLFPVKRQLGRIPAKRTPCCI